MTGPTGPTGPVSGLDSGWRYFGYAGEVQLRSGLVPYDASGSQWNPGRYRRDAAGCVFLEGLFARTAVSGTPLFTLPQGFRPAYRQIHGIISEAGSSLQVYVYSDGNVVVAGDTSVSIISLNGITFMAEDAQTVAWTDLTLKNGWVRNDPADSPPGYFIDSAGDVHLRGIVKNGTGTIATLPVGAHQSDFHQMYEVPCGGTVGALARVDVALTGDLNPVNYSGGGNNTWVSLDGIVITNPTGSWPLTIPLINNWQQYGGPFPPASVRVNKNGIASLRGLVRSGTAGAAMTNAGAIPVSLAPTFRSIMLGSAAPEGSAARVDVAQDGSIIHVSYINGGANTWVSLAHRWFVESEGVGLGGGSTPGPTGPQGPGGVDEVTIAHQPSPTGSNFELWVDLDTDSPAAGTGMPPGGSQGQVLTKDSGTDYAVSWKSVARGLLAYAERTSDYTGTQQSWNDIPGLSITFTVEAGRKIKVCGHVMVNKASADVATTVAVQARSSDGSIVNQVNIDLHAPDTKMADPVVIFTSAAKSYTFVLSLMTQSGYVNAWAGSNYKAIIWAEDIGAA